MTHRKLVARYHRAAAIGLIASLASVTLGGCFNSGSVERDRQANLNSAVEAFDAASISNVLCESSGGEAELGQGYEHLVVLEGAESMEAVLNRFSKLEYAAAGSPPEVNFSSSNRVYANVRELKSPEALDKYSDDLNKAECVIPAAGAVWVKFGER